MLSIFERKLDGGAHDMRSEGALDHFMSPTGSLQTHLGKSILPNGGKQVGDHIPISGMVIEIILIAG